MNLFIYLSSSLTEIVGKPVFARKPAKSRQRLIVTVVSENVKLTCKAEGSQPISYKWTKDGKSFSLQKYEAHDYRLRIENVAVSDSGNYTCTASNSFGSISFTYNVMVFGKFPFLQQGKLKIPSRYQNAACSYLEVLDALNLRILHVSILCTM